MTGFLVLWREQCERDKIQREAGIDEIRYIYQVANLSPRGQFYLRPSNKMKFVVPGANVKYNPPWKDEWIVVEGEWGRSVHIGGTEYPVPTQFSPRDKWTSEELSPESEGILTRIQERGYINMQYPSCDPFEGARLERYLRISVADPGD